MFVSVEHTVLSEDRLSQIVYKARLGDLGDPATCLALSSIEYQDRKTPRHKFVTTSAWYRSEQAGRFAYRNNGVSLLTARPVVPQEVWTALWNGLMSKFAWRYGDGVIG